MGTLEGIYTNKRARKRTEAETNLGYTRWHYFSIALKKNRQGNQYKLATPRTPTHLNVLQGEPKRKEFTVAVG